MLTKVLRISGALTVAVAVAVIAPAANAMTIRTGDPKVSGRISINVPVTVGCSAFDPSLTHFGDNVTVTVQQAAGREIAFGTGTTGGSLFSGSSLLFACDGTEQTVPVTVLANTSGPPFHGGPAVLSASASAQAGQSCGTGCFFNIAGQSASTGPLNVRL